MTNNFNINLYKKSQQNSNSTKTPHEVVRFLMENLLNSMKSLQSTLQIKKDQILKTNKKTISFLSIKKHFKGINNNIQSTSFTRF